MLIMRLEVARNCVELSSSNLVDSCAFKLNTAIN